MSSRVVWEASLGSRHGAIVVLVLDSIVTKGGDAAIHESVNTQYLFIK